MTHQCHNIINARDFFNEHWKYRNNIVKLELKYKIILIDMKEKRANFAELIFVN